MISNIFGYYRRMQIRNLMRGFRHALQSGSINSLRMIESSLVGLRLPLVLGLAERTIFGTLYPKTEIIVRQYLLQRYAGPPLRKTFFIALGGKRRPIVYPLPYFWRRQIVESGIQVSCYASSFAWGVAVLSRYLHGAMFIMRLCLQGLVSGFSALVAEVQPYASFHGLHKRNLPNSADGQLGYDVCSWYLSWSGRDPAVKAIVHDVTDVSSIKLGELNIKYLPEPHASLKSFKQAWLFMLWAIPSLMLSLISMLRGRWWNALMLAEAARAKVVSLTERPNLASDYMFHFSRSIYRPMWTYVAESKGSRILCYFYSTYAQPRLCEADESQSFEWGPTTWPMFLVWDKYQAISLRRDLGSSVPISVVGPVYFSDPLVEVPTLPIKAVAIFDIEPHRKSNTYGISTLYEYYYAYPAVHRRFLEDIYVALGQAGLSIVLKSKRYIANDGDKSYVSFVQRFAEKPGVIIAPPELAAPRLMRQCLGAISAPFTSTALYFRDEGYPSIYYDPLSLLDKDDPGAHGIPILASRSELIKWAELALVCGNQFSESK